MGVLNCDWYGLYRGSCLTMNSTLGLQQFQQIWSQDTNSRVRVIIRSSSLVQGVILLCVCSSLMVNNFAHTKFFYHILRKEKGVLVLIIFGFILQWIWFQRCWIHVSRKKILNKFVLSKFAQVGPGSLERKVMKSPFRFCRDLGQRNLLQQEQKGTEIQAKEQTKGKKTFIYM